jgi:hypothetical protein
VLQSLDLDSTPSNTFWRHLSTSGEAHEWTTSSTRRGVPPTLPNASWKHPGNHCGVDNPMPRTPLLLDVTPPIVTRTSPHSELSLHASHGGVGGFSLLNHHASHGVVTLLSQDPHHSHLTRNNFSNTDQAAFASTRRVPRQQ